MIGYDTRRLTRASLELSATGGRGLKVLLLATAVVLPLLTAGGALYLRDPAVSPFTFTLTSASTTETLAEENAMLRAELDKARVELDMDRATRQELNRQASALNDQINELTNRLEFLAARNNPVAESR